jgi:hypothetical protein
VDFASLRLLSEKEDWLSTGDLYSKNTGDCSLPCLPKSKTDSEFCSEDNIFSQASLGGGRGEGGNLNKEDTPKAEKFGASVNGGSIKAVERSSPEKCRSAGEKKGGDIGKGEENSLHGKSGLAEGRLEVNENAPYDWLVFDSPECVVSAVRTAVMTAVTVLSISQCIHDVN